MYVYVMATEEKVIDEVNSMGPACLITTELKTLTDKPPQPLNHSHHYISRSSDCLCNARDANKTVLPPTKGGSVQYSAAPDITLSDFKLRVPSSAWNKGCHAQQISQWKSDPHIAVVSSVVDTLEQWEIEVHQTCWEDIKTKYNEISEQMLQLLLTWQQQNGGQADRQQLVTALYSSHLNNLAHQVKEKNYTSNNPLSRYKHHVTNRSDQDYSYQDEKRRSSVPVLQRQMTQNTLRTLLQLKKRGTIDE